MKIGSYPHAAVFKLFLAIILVGSLISSSVFAEMQSQNYKIEKDSINFTGLDDGKSANYNLSDTGGELDSGDQRSSSTLMTSGYQYTTYDPLFFSFTVNAQVESSKTAYTAFSQVASTVTMVSINGYGIGDYVGVLEINGTNYLLKVGKVISTSTNTLIVDGWSGIAGETMSASPAGGDDYVYRLSGNDVSLGIIDVTSIKSAISMFEVSTNSVNGYIVDYSQDHNLQIDSTHYIAPVADGAVTIGSNEYGIKSVGPDKQGVGDMAASTTPQTFSLNLGRVSESRSGSIYKAAVSNFNSVGHYSHSITYRATLNF